MKKRTLLSIAISSLAINTFAQSSDSNKEAVDIGVFYTKEALKHFTKEQLHQYVQERFDWANQALDESNISLERHFSLFEASPFDNPDLLKLTDFWSYAFDRQDQLNDYIDRYGLDYVTVITDTHDRDFSGCGVASVGGYFSVIRVGIVEETFCGHEQSKVTFAHEWGHLDGAAHDMSDRGLEKKPYGIGYHCDNTSTIMSTEMNTANRHQLYSSPEVFRNNDACGVNDVADVSRMIRERMQEAGAIQNTHEPMPIAGDVSFQLAADVVSETEAVLTGEITLAEPVTEPVSVQLFTQHGTTNDDDFTPLMDRFVIPIGEMSVNFSISLSDDSVYEIDEQFLVGIRYPERLNVVSEPVLVTLTSDEQLPLLSLAMDIPESGVEETSGQLVGRLALTSPLENTVSVRLASEHISTDDQDFTALDQVIEIPAGETQADFSLTILNDDNIEEIETFALTLSEPNGVRLEQERIEISLVSEDVEPAPVPSPTPTPVPVPSPTPTPAPVPSPTPTPAPVPTPTSEKASASGGGSIGFGFLALLAGLRRLGHKTSKKGGMR